MSLTAEEAVELSKRIEAGETPETALALVKRAA